MRPSFCNSVEAHWLAERELTGAIMERAERVVEERGGATFFERPGVTFMEWDCEQLELVF